MTFSLDTRSSFMFSKSDAQTVSREMEAEQRPGQPSNANDPSPDLFLCCMRDDPELMDQIVADAYRQRRAISPIS